jgi:dTDP-4-dehydrorhamnose reductase
MERNNDKEGLILTLGSDGLVGSRFVELSKYRSNLKTPKSIELDILNRDEIAAVVRSFAFKAIVNFAAFTDVNAAEAQRGDKNGACWKVNVDGARNLAEIVASCKGSVHLIHISTDMVFSGSKDDKGPYAEKHPVEDDLEKVTWYGYTKGQSEKVIRDILGDKATIIRIMYPVRAKFDKKLDYLRKPLRLYDEKKLYPLICDQTISISFIDELSAVIDKVIDLNLFATLHVSSCDTTTPYDIVSYMLKRVRSAEEVVSPITFRDFIKSIGAPPYRYPQFGGLSVSESENLLGMKFSTCKQVVDRLIEQGLG